MPDETNIQQLATAALTYLDRHTFTTDNGRLSVFAASLPELTRRVGRLLQCRPDPSLRVRPPCYDDFHDLAEAVGAGDPVDAAAAGAMAVLGQGGERFNICALRGVLERLAGTKAISGPARPKRHKRKAGGKPRPLTTKQAEAIQLWGEYKGNIAAVAAAMGVHRATAQQHIDAAHRKLGKAVVKRAVKHERLRTDRRGQPIVEGR